MTIKKSAAAFMFTAAVLLIVFLIGSMFPFGDGTVSWCDMNQQGIPLLCDFKDILEGKDGMFLNFHNASGMNFYGVFFFFLASPFSFLCVFVDKVDIPYLINIIVVLKLALSALTASLYFSKRFKALSFLENMALSASYGLCGYGMMFFQNVMWLDIMYMFPLLMLGIYKLINEDKPLLYTITLTLTLIMNYYISYMVLLFVILYFGVLTLRKIGLNKKVYLNLGVCTLSSLLMSAVVLLPCFLQYTQSARREDVISGLMSTDFFGSTYTTVPVMLCTAIIIAVLIISIPTLFKQNRDFKTNFIIFVLLCLPLFIEPINLMWHTGNYMSFPARFAFITVFIGLILVANCLENATDCKPSVLKYLIIAGVVVASLVYVMNWYTDKNIKTLTAYVRTLWGDRESLRALLILFAFAVIGYILVLFFRMKNYISKRIFALLLCLLVLGEGICSVKIYMNSAKDKFNYSNFEEFIKLEDSVPQDEFYRVNIDEKFIDANMTGAIGFNSIGHYTSLNNLDTMTAAKQFGYIGYWMETGNWGGSILSDALLSVKYTAINDYGEYVLKENPYYLGMGIKSKNALPELISDKDRIAEIGKIFAQITGTNNSVRMITPAKKENCSYNYNIFEENYTISKHNEAAALVYKVSITDSERLYFDCYNGFSNNLTEKINNSLAVFVDGSPVAKTYPTQRLNGFLDLGVYENCELEITVKIFEDISASSFGLYGIKEDVVTSAIEKAETLNLKKNGGTLVGTVNEAGNYFISVPYSDDLNVTLDGKKVEYKKALTGFISVDLKNGGELKITSTPSGFVLGIIISLVGIVVALAWFVYFKNKFAEDNKICNVVFVLFCVVFIVMLLLVYILPVFLNLFA